MGLPERPTRTLLPAMPFHMSVRYQLKTLACGGDAEEEYIQVTGQLRTVYIQVYEYGVPLRLNSVYNSISLPIYTV